MGYFFSAATTALMMKASGVTLTPALAFSSFTLRAERLELGDVRLVELRDVRDHHPVARERRARDLLDARARPGLDRAELGEVDLRPRGQAQVAEPAARARAGAAAGQRLLHEGLDVVLEDAALGAGARDRGESTPSSRAKRRTPGLRVGRCRRLVGCGRGRRGRRREQRQAREQAPERARERARASPAPCGRGGSARVAAGVGDRRSCRGRRRPSVSRPQRAGLTLSPTLTRISFTMPADGDGTSIVALSLSSVTQRVVLLHRVARLDQHLDDRHVLEVADVGDLHFDGGQRLSSCYSRVVVSWFVTPYVVAPSHTVHGAGLSGSMPYFLIASATFAAGTSPSSASAFSAATVT